MASTTGPPPGASMDPASAMAMDPHAAEAQAQLNQFVACVVGFAGGATLAVLFRLGIRRFNQTKLAGDDLAIALTLIPLWGLVAAELLLAFRGGLGMPMAYLSPSQFDVFYKAFYASCTIYAIAVTGVRISILLLYRRIFRQHRRFQWCLCATGGLCMLWCGAVTIVTLFQCEPISRAWNPRVEGSCIDLRAFFFATAVSNAILDVIVNVLPVRLVWQLQLPLRQRLTLMLILVLGILSIFASVGRCVAVPQLISTDLPASAPMPLVYTVIEPAFATILVCLTTYRPFVTGMWIVLQKPLSSLRSHTSHRRRSGKLWGSKSNNGSDDSRSRGSETDGSNNANGSNASNAGNSVDEKNDMARVTISADPTGYGSESQIPRSRGAKDFLNGRLISYPISCRHGGLAVPMNSPTTDGRPPSSMQGQDGLHPNYAAMRGMSQPNISQQSLSQHSYSQHSFSLQSFSQQSLSQPSGSQYSLSQPSEAELSWTRAREAEHISALS